MLTFGQRVRGAELPAPAPSWSGVGIGTLAETPFATAQPAPRRLPYHLLALTTAGHGTVEVDFVSGPCRPGTLLWIRPGQALRFGGQPGLDAAIISWERYLLSADQIAGVPVDDPTGPGRWQLAGEDEDAMISEFAQLAVDFDRHAQKPGGTNAAPAKPGETSAAPAKPGETSTGPAKPGETSAAPARPGPVSGGIASAGAARGIVTRNAVAAALLRHQLAVLLLRIALLSTDDRTEWISAESRTFARFRRTLEEGHADSRRVEDYAARLGCSVRTLTRASLALTGRTAKQVVDDRVALEARRLLACTPLSVAEVGRHLGFPEPTNFGRFFHREVGLSPGGFRHSLGSPETRMPAPRSPAD